MGKAEAEAAATLIVRACQVKGDRWQSLAFDEISSVVMADVRGGVEPLASLSENPFWKPDYEEVVKRGFARLTGSDYGSEAFVALTEDGIKALQRHRTHVKF